MAEFEADGSIVREASEGTSLADTWIASDEALSWTQSNIASFNPAQNLFRQVYNKKKTYTSAALIT